MSVSGQRDIGRHDCIGNYKQISFEGFELK